MTSTVSAERRFLGASALLFTGSAVATAGWCGSMSAMGGMEMPGGWTMSMAWMAMPGQTWPGAAASFLGMWTVMMVAMMLPSLVPMLGCYRRAVSGAGEARLGLLTAVAGVGYYLSGQRSAWPPSRWALPWRDSRCSTRPWRAPYRS